MNLGEEGECEMNKVTVEIGLCRYNSTVRVCHLPTGETVSTRRADWGIKARGECRKSAMRILRTRLYAIQNNLPEYHIKRDYKVREDNSIIFPDNFGSE